MSFRYLLAGSFSVLLLAAAGCSKTEDKAADKRLFGDPPTFVGAPEIQSTPAHLSCDVTEAVVAHANRNLFDTFTLMGPITIGTAYTEAVMKVAVEDKQGIEDILGVFASYQKTPKNEVSLVLLDDGPHTCPTDQSDAEIGCFPYFVGQVQQTCHTELVCDKRLQCDYEASRREPPDSTEPPTSTCIDQICTRVQECTTSYECVCGTANCDFNDPNTRTTVCMGFPTLSGIGDPCSATDCDPEKTPGETYVVCENPNDLGIAHCQETEGARECVELEDCVEQPKCTITKYFMTTKDQNKGDGTFSRDLALVNLTTTGVGGDLVRDCIVKNTNVTPIGVEQGTSVDFRIEVVDRSANDTQWPREESVTAAKSAFECQGDPCLCCILEKGLDANSPDDDPAGCSGLQGLVGARLTQGFCKQCLKETPDLLCCAPCDDTLCNCKGRDYTHAEQCACGLLPKVECGP